MRGHIKDRGSYLYYLAEASMKSDPNWEKAFREALSQYGCMRCRTSFGSVNGLDELAAVYPNEVTKKIFDSDVIERDDEHMLIKAGYCPLMHAWVDCGGDDALVAKLCDIAMDGDRAMMGGIPGIEFELKKSLAFGDEQCEFLIRRKKEDAE